MRCLAVVAVALIMTGTVAAQLPGQPGYKSPLPPALNLNGLGRDPAVNLYNAVIPAQRARAMQDRLGLQETLQRRALTLDDQDDVLPSLPETGHVARFLNYGPYYSLGTQAPSAALYPVRPPARKK